MDLLVLPVYALWRMCPEPRATLALSNGWAELMGSRRFIDVRILVASCTYEFVRGARLTTSTTSPLHLYA